MEEFIEFCIGQRVKVGKDIYGSIGYIAKTVIWYWREDNGKYSFARPSDCKLVDTEGNVLANQPVVIVEEAPKVIVIGEPTKEWEIGDVQFDSFSARAKRSLNRIE